MFTFCIHLFCGSSEEAQSPAVLHILKTPSNRKAHKSEDRIERAVEDI